MKPGDLVVLLNREVMRNYCIEIPLGTIIRFEEGPFYLDIVCDAIFGGSFIYVGYRFLYMSKNEIKLFFNSIR